MEELLERTREKHKGDVEELEKKWREEQQIAFDRTQQVCDSVCCFVIIIVDSNIINCYIIQCKDAQQEALDCKDDLVT